MLLRKPSSLYSAWLLTWPHILPAGINQIFDQLLNLDWQ